MLYYIQTKNTNIMQLTVCEMMYGDILENILGLWMSQID